MLGTALCLASLSALMAAPQEGSGGARGGSRVIRVYVGSFTNGTTSKGITLLELDPVTGVLTTKGLAVEASNPAFLAIHPSRKFVYAVSEVDEFEGKKTGAVSAFALDEASGTLKLLNSQASGGRGPCHVVVDRLAKHVLVANYTGGSVAVLPIGDDGRLAPASSTVQHQGKSVNPQRQEAPHAHSINVDHGNKFAVAADLGLDQVFVYRLDAAKGTLTPNDPPFTKIAAGSGPRHFAFHPDGRHAYVINELLSTVTAFDFDAARGVLETSQTISTLPEGFKGVNWTAEVQVHPSGKFLYGSNRGHDSIAIFAIDAVTGKLTPVGQQPTGGKTPRNFGIDPTGSFLLAANQDSDTIVVFRINPRTGGLEPTGQSAQVPKPVCVKMYSLGE